MAADISEGLKQVKKSGSNEKRAALRAFKSLAFGENVKKSHAQRSLSQVVSWDQKSIQRGIKRRTGNRPHKCKYHGNQHIQRSPKSAKIKKPINGNVTI